MRTKLIMIFYFILLLSVFCSKENNPINTTITDTDTTDTTIIDTTISDTTVTDTTISDTTSTDTTISDTTVNEDEFNNLLITTDTTTYTWNQGVDMDDISIPGLISNKSGTVFYSRLGDGFLLGEQLNLFIAVGSDGYIEKYDASDSTWKERELRSFLIEGVKVVPINPSQDYSIYGFFA